MNISLTREFVAKKVESGLYKSASEVVREGLRLLAKSEARPGFMMESQAELRAKLQAGIDSLDAGKALAVEDVVAELAHLSREKRAEAHAD